MSLIAVAKSHGYRSVEEMLDAVASGELITVLLADEQRSYAIERLIELAPQQDGITAEAFFSLANQLQNPFGKKIEMV